MRVAIRLPSFFILAPVVKRPLEPARVSAISKVAGGKFAPKMAQRCAQASVCERTRRRRQEAETGYSYSFKTSSTKVESPLRKRHGVTFLERRVAPPYRTVPKLADEITTDTLHKRPVTRTSTSSVGIRRHLLLKEKACGRDLIFAPF